MTRALAVALCLAAVPALAFEGVIETKMTMNRGKMEGATEGTPSSFSGTGTITLKGLNSRMEHQMTMPGMGGGGKTVVIYRGDEKTTYILNTAAKTYSKHVQDKLENESDSSTWTVKKLGKDTVAGRSTEHVQVQKTSGARFSSPLGVAKLARAYRPAAGMINAAVTSMTAENPSALSAMPSGGA